MGGRGTTAARGEAMGVSYDAVQYAAQIGRLDILTATLSVLVVILGLGAFPLFFFVRHRAARIAADSASEALKGAQDRVESLAISKLESMLPTLVTEYMELVKNSVRAEEGDQIAEAESKDAGR